MIITRGLGNPQAVVTRGLGAGISIVVFRAVLEAVGSVTSVAASTSTVDMAADIAATVTAALGLDTAATRVAEHVATLTGMERTELLTAVNDHLAGTDGAMERLEAVLATYGMAGLVGDATDGTDSIDGWEHS